MDGSIHSAIRESDGAFPAPPGGPSLELGSVVADRFVLCAHLGKGRYGQVYKALDRAWSDGQLRLEQHVALHIFDDRIRPQTRLLRKLEGSYLQPHLWAHPNIVKIRGFGSDRGAYFLSTELLEGRSLRAVLDAIRPNVLSPDTAFALLRSVGDALTYAHGKNVVHGDVRPGTIFVTADKAVKVLDLLPASNARSTPFFVEDTAPNGLYNPDPRDDVYGLACLAYELVAGVHPYHGATALEALHEGITPMPVAGLAPRRWGALARGLALRRADRTASIVEFLAELRVRAPDRDTASLRAAKAAIEPRTGRLAADDEIVLFGDLTASPRAAAETDRGGARVTGDRWPKREAGTARTAEPDLGFRASQLRAPWQPSEPVISQQDVQACMGYARRRRERRRSRAGVPLLSIGILAAFGMTAYLTHEPFADSVQQLLAAGVGALGFGVREARVAAVREPTGTAAPDPIVPVMSSRVAAASAEPVQPRVATAAAATTELPRAAAATEAAAPTTVAPAAAEPGTRIAADEPPTAAAAEAAGAATAGPERFELAPQGVTVSESQASAAVVIHRRGGTLAPASVIWWTSDGTAVAGEDYADLGRQIATFAAGEDTHTILVPIIADFVIEDRESFYVNMTVNGSAAAQLMPEQRLEVVIVDDDR